MKQKELTKTCMKIQIEEKTLLKTDIDFTMKLYRMNSVIWADTDISFIVNNTVQSVIKCSNLSQLRSKYQS